MTTSDFHPPTALIVVKGMPTATMSVAPVTLSNLPVTFLRLHSLAALAMDIACEENLLPLCLNEWKKGSLGFHQPLSLSAWI